MSLTPAPDDDGTAAEPAAEASHPCVQGLIAATVALMTAYANPAPGAAVDLAGRRRMLARKLVSNLSFLREHPLLSPALRQVMAHAHQHWQCLAAPVPAPAQAWAAPAPGLRH